jgi:hypothetical protein
MARDFREVLNPPSRQRGYAGLALLLALAVAVVRHTRAQGESHFLATQRYEDVYYLPPPDWLMVFALGHRETVADLIWLRSLIYFGDEIVHRGNVDNLHQYADAMLTLDPYFNRVYGWAATCSVYRGGTPGVADIRRAIGYLERGVRRFPDDGELAYSLGAFYLYELRPLISDRKEIANISLLGAEQLQTAARLGAGPPWLVLSSASELKKLGQNEQLIRHLTEVYEQVSDPEVKEQIEIQLSKLQSEAFSEAMRRTVQEFDAAHRRDFPYVDRDLYGLLGQRPAFDGQAQLLRNFDPAPDRADLADAAPAH